MQTKRHIQLQEDAVLFDTHSELNRVYHRYLIKVSSIDCVIEGISLARSKNLPLIISGGRHAMGGQQFVHGGVVLDMGDYNQILEFCPERGHIKVEAGIFFDRLIEEIVELNRIHGSNWAIIQKPSGADRISLGGAVSANVHGRVLNHGPFIEDIESLEIIDSWGRLQRVDRDHELFNLVTGGYGLFGVVVSVTLRLRSRALMRRHVSKINLDELLPRLEKLVEEGHEYGDFQFAIDPASEGFLHTGILATYKAVKQEPGADSENRVLSMQDWSELLRLAHVDKSAAFQKYLDHYLKTDGQVYWSDTMQLGTYLDGYHSKLDKDCGLSRGTEIITELYVPPGNLSKFMNSARKLFRKENANLIYGTVRLIKADRHTFLAWAREDFACIIFNLHTTHGQEGERRSAKIFRELIALARSYGGSFYLTYHRYVEKDDLLGCYPQFEEFLKKKLDLDPEELFQSQWYRHYRDLLKGSPQGI